MFLSPSRVVALASVVSIAPAAFAGVLTVAPSGAAYTEITAAVAAASDGDVILVRAGGYAGFAIDGKAIAVVADAGANVQVYERVFVRNIASTQTAILSGIGLLRPWGGAALTLENCAGHVRVQSVSAIGGQYVFGGAWSALELTNCADASFVACAFTGGNPEYGGLGWGHNGASALRASSSTIALHDCTLVGGGGLFGYTNPPGPTTYGQPGRPAAEISGGQLFARGTTFQGGAGGRGQSTDACPTTPYVYETGGGDGGPGLRVNGGAATLVGVTALGGAGGVGGTNGCGAQAYSGSAGLPVDPPSIVPNAAPPMSMAVPAPAREGSSLSFSFTGPAGHRVILATSSGPAYAPAFQGVLLLGTPLRRVPMGVIPANGFLDVQLPVPALAPGVDARLLHTQAAFVDPNTGQSWLASPGVVVMLDASL